MSRKAIALVGDYSEAHTAHRAIPLALELARASLGADLSWTWVSSSDVRDPSSDLASFSGVWIVPGSPYKDMDGALGAVRWAREGGHPFFGSCGGFQHALIEIARDVAGITAADHAESNPTGSALLIAPLSCALKEKAGPVHFAAGSMLAEAYGASEAVETYHCSYGPDASYRGALEAAGLRFTAWDDAGDVRGAELTGHPFFCGTLFQSERRALNGDVPPLVRAFVKAVCALD